MGLALFVSALPVMNSKASCFLKAFACCHYTLCIPWHWKVLRVGPRQAVKSEDCTLAYSLSRLLILTVVAAGLLWHSGACQR